MRLPVADASVDAVTIAFGIRNVQQPEVACAELLRVLRPGGRLAILEFGLPVVPAVRPLYLWYFNHVLPRIGRAVSRHNAAYDYLPQSVGSFPVGRRLRPHPHCHRIFTGESPAAVAGDRLSIQCQEARGRRWPVILS